MAEKKKKEIVIKEAIGDVLEKLIDFCYSGQFAITNDNICDVLAAVSMLTFSDIEKECAVFLTSILIQNPNNCLSTYAIAYLYRSIVYYMLSLTCIG